MTELEELRQEYSQARQRARHLAVVARGSRKATAALKRFGRLAGELDAALVEARRCGFSAGSPAHRADAKPNKT